ncbi:MAG: hypothetical protein NC548_60155, partial [Lachnospiraceae bacterium]|nr:hypothetical protein [Lachnospiraceae bacterium]
METSLPLVNLDASTFSNFPFVLSHIFLLPEYSAYFVTEPLSFGVHIRSNGLWLVSMEWAVVS